MTLFELRRLLTVGRTASLIDVLVLRKQKQLSREEAMGIESIIGLIVAVIATIAGAFGFGLAIPVRRKQKPSSSVLKSTPQPLKRLLSDGRRGNALGSR